jgi:hypothetical protein
LVFANGLGVFLCLGYLPDECPVVPISSSKSGKNSCLLLEDIIAGFGQILLELFHSLYPDEQETSFFCHQNLWLLHTLPDAGKSDSRRI